MKFNFKVSGGIAGLTFVLNGDSASLPDAPKKTVESLANGTLKLTKKKPDGLTRDALKYELNVPDAPKKFSAQYDESTLPPEIESLFSYLRQNAPLRK